MIYVGRNKLEWPLTVIPTLLLLGPLVTDGFGSVFYAAANSSFPALGKLACKHVKNLNDYWH